MVTEINPSYYSLMNHEIELKLRLNASELPVLETLLNTEVFDPQPTLKLLNRYFDTPTMGLSQAGAALRIRQQAMVDDLGMETDSRIIQTLKTRGHSDSGLHQRMEWDWPLTQVELDSQLIASSEVQQHLDSDLPLDQIGPLFTTDFLRKVWLYRHEESLVELVLDQGQVSTSEHQVDLLELELELKQGQPEVLFQLAQQLADQCPLLMSDISKAERGYGLLALTPQYQQIKKDWSGKVPAFDEQQDVISCFKTFFSYQLSLCQRSLEQDIWDNGMSPLSQKNAEKLKHQLQSLQVLLAIFAPIDCLPQAQLLQRQINHALQQEFSVSIVWGQICLACGQWLYQLAEDAAEFEMTAEEKNSMRLYAEQLLQGIKG